MAAKCVNSAILVSVVLSLVLSEVYGHVALTFPPARRYDLDFLDNARTKGPCGMPKGSIRTSLLAGSTFNVHWHLAYAHRGGFSLKILDNLERSLLDLTPSVAGSQFVRDDVTAQQYEVKLPADFTCENCTLQLQREAGEWASEYRFHSCADIDILPKPNYHETCSGHGTYILGRCKCSRLRWGPRCQFYEECQEDSDCGLRGKCVDIHATESPTKNCYCSLGFFGKGCNKKAPLKDKKIDFGVYSHRELSKDFSLYWRILKDEGEVEMVMVANSTSFVGVGWRPKGLTAMCRNFPVLGPPINAPAKKTQVKQEPVAEPEPKSEPNAKAEPHPEPNSKPEPEPTSEPKSEPEPSSEPKSEPEPSSEPKSEPEPTSEPKAEPEPTLKASLRSELRSEPKPELSSEPKPTSEPKAEPEPTSEPHAEPEPTSEPNTEQSSSTEADSNKKYKRVAMHSLDGIDFKSLGDDVTVKTSISYQVSKERGKRALLEEGTNYETSTPLTIAHSTPSPEPKSEPKPTPEPKSEPEPKAEPEPTSEPKAEPEPTSEPKSEPEPTSEPTSEPKPSSEPKSEPEPSSEPTSKPEPSSEPKSEPEPRSEPKPEPTSEPKAEPEPHPEPKSEPEPHPEPKSEPHSELKSEPKPHPEPEPHPEPKSEPEPVSLLVKGLNNDTGYFPEHAYSPKHDFNGMDCTDIVIGTARGNYHRVLDYYTRDRSTPRVDTFWEGRDDLTAASGFEENGVTTIMFRKKLKAKEPTDHSIVDELMHVIWARGQEPNHYVHNPKSGLERDKASVGDFYRQDEIKYHGHSDQRGVTAINFFEEVSSRTGGEITPLPDRCGGQWMTPSNCTPGIDCEYSASWEYLGFKRGKDSIRFTITTKHSDAWTGIGFSNDKKMSQTDAIIGWIDARSGRPFLMDTWISGYSAPKLDNSQDISQDSGGLQDGVTTLSFVRKRQTKDTKDLSFTDDQCLYMMFPVHGGQYEPVNKRMNRHHLTPIVTGNRVCIKSCGPEMEDEITTEKVIPGLKSYSMLVKIVGLADNFKPPLPGSQEYEDLSKQIKKNFGGSLQKQPGYYDIELDHLMQNSTNDMIAEMTLKAIDSNSIEGARSLDAPPSGEDSTKQRWERAVKETLATGKVGNLNVDPTFYVFEPQSLLSTLPVEQASGNSRTFFGLSETKLYIVLGCVCALVFVALVQAGCTIYRGVASKSNLTKDQLIPNSAWKDYSTNTNYAFEAFENDEKYNGTTSTAPVRDRTSTTPSTKSATNGTRNGKATNGNGHTAKVFPNSAAQYYHETRSLQRPRGQYGYTGRPERATYSLPRGPRAHDAPPAHAHSASSAHPPAHQPDFYFMPSQRKYEGEVVRVYVDYNDM